MGQVKFSNSRGEEQVLNVNVDTYIDLAGRTNNPKYDEVYLRMINRDMNHGIPLLLKGIADILDRDLDAVKKHIFYGKQTDTKLITQMVNDCLTTNTPDMSHFKDNKEMIDIFHGVVGLATEAGEMIKALLQFMETGKIDIVNMGEENGDAFWYQALLLKRSGKTFEEVMTTNIQKLAERFKDGFTEEDAINRNVEAERVILENGLSENTGHHFVD